jgi:chromosomal replication initiation ATPase DnaA
MDFAAVRDGEDAAKARLAQHAVAFVFNLPVDDIAAPTRRSKRAAFARQVAMYLVHTAFGVPVARTAQAFGRDRTTVAHACQLIEDRREDPALDDRLDALESFLRAAPDPVREKAA